MILRGIRFGGLLLCILEFDGGVVTGRRFSAGVWCFRHCGLVIVIRRATVILLTLMVPFAWKYFARMWYLPYIDSDLRH